MRAASLPSVLDRRFRQAGDELDAARRAQRVEARARRFVGVEVVAAMDERDAAGRGRAFLARGDRRRHRRFGAADDDDALAGVLVQGRGVLEELRAAEAVEPVDLEPARLERADAAGDDDRLGDEARSGRGGDVEAAVVAARDRAHLLVEMKAGAERLDLLEQLLGELAAGGDGQGGDVVDGLVGIELDALAAGVRQRIDDLRAHLLQAELEHLEQADRAGADDDDVGLDRVEHGSPCRQRARSPIAGPAGRSER